MKLPPRGCPVSASVMLAAEVAPTYTVTPEFHFIIVVEITVKNNRNKKKTKC
jgi:hypothetical protein